MTYVLKLIGLSDGTPTPFDGQYVREYDSSCNGIDACGNELLVYLIGTDDIREAKHYATAMDALEDWKRVDSRNPIRKDGYPNRPLTAFYATCEPYQPVSNIYQEYMN